MTEVFKGRLPGACPKCSTAVTNEPLCTGMWSGAKANGKPAGGGVLTTICVKCGSPLLAYEDVYNEDGEVDADHRLVLTQPHWQLDKPAS